MQLMGKPVEAFGAQPLKRQSNNNDMRNHSVEAGKDRTPIHQERNQAQCVFQQQPVL